MIFQFWHHVIHSTKTMWQRMVYRMFFLSLKICVSSPLYTKIFKKPKYKFFPKSRFFQPCRPSTKFLHPTRKKTEPGLGPVVTVSPDFEFAVLQKSSVVLQRRVVRLHTQISYHIIYTRALSNSRLRPANVSFAAHDELFKNAMQFG